MNITVSENMIDRLKKKGYNVRILNIDAPIDTFNPSKEELKKEYTKKENNNE